jgi:hypothetical protein
LVAGTTEVSEAPSGVTLPERGQLQRRGVNSSNFSPRTRLGFNHRRVVQWDLAVASDGTALRLTDIDQRANRITGYTVPIDGGVPTEHVYGGLEMAHLVHIDSSVRGDLSVSRSLAAPTQRISYEPQDFAQQLGVSGNNTIRE